MRIRIRIQQTKNNADPDPQHWKKKLTCVEGILVGQVQLTVPHEGRGDHHHSGWTGLLKWKQRLEISHCSCKQKFTGSGSAWNRIDLALLDPD